MSKKIFLLLAFFMASTFIKAQVPVYRYTSDSFNETKIAEILETAKKNGTQQWELDKLQTHLYKRLYNERHQGSVPNTLSQRTFNPNTVMAGCTDCSNIGFENGTESGWTLKTGDVNGQNLPCNTCTNGSSSFSPVFNVVNSTFSGNTATTGTDVCSQQRVLPPGITPNTYALEINDNSTGGKIMEADYQLNVTAANNIVTYEYLCVLEDPNDGAHAVNQKPYFFCQVLNGSGTAIPCTQDLQQAGTAAPGFIACPAVGGCTDSYYKGWVTVTLDLTSYEGQCITLQFIASDCSLGGHFGYAYVDVQCDQEATDNTVTICPGSTQLCGQAGYTTYNWAGPVTGTTQCLNTSTPGDYTLTCTGQCPAPVRHYTVVVSPTPTVSFSSTVTPCSNSVPFTDLTTVSGGGSVANWAWTFTGGTPATSTSQNPTVTYGATGTFNVVLTCTSTAGCTGNYSSSVTLASGPTAAFSASTVCPGNPTVFTNTSTSATGYSWDFGEPSSGASNTSTATNPTHTYAGPGTYTAVLSATGTGTCVATHSVAVVVSPIPTASISTSPVCLGQSTVFTSTINPTAGTTYVWSFGGAGTGSNITTAIPSFIYSGTGTFPVTVTVTAAGGCTVTATTNAVVNNGATATISVPAVCQGTGSVFTSTINPTAGTTYAWNFGGAGSGTGLTTATPTFTYSSSNAAPGFPVTVTVTAVGGCSVTATTNAVVNTFPILSFTTTPACDQSALVINNTTANQAAISTWNWDFGDNNGTSTIAAPGSYMYPAPGIYTVVLTATATTGCSGTVTATAIVHPNPIPFPYYYYTCFGSGSDFTDSSFVINPPGINDAITTWNYSFGDGSSSPLPSPTHTYAACGSYSVTLTVSTNFNCTDAVSFLDTVYCIPQVIAPASFDVCPATAVTSAQTTFTTTCQQPYYGTLMTVYSVDNPNFQNNTTTPNTGISSADNVGFDFIPNYNSIAQNLTCGLISDAVYGYPLSVDANGYGCEGGPSTFTISVYPTPTVTPVSDINVCANQPVNVPNFTGCPTPETFNWITTGPNVGITAVSPANIGSFTSQNATDLVAVSQVSVTPVANGCTGAPTTFSITVNPLPTLTVSSYTACPGTNVPSPTIVTDPVTGVTLAWAVTNNVNIGMPVSGTGIPTAYIAPANASLINQIGVVTYTPTLNTCVGTIATETITISPTPVIQPITDVFYCPNQPTTSIPFVCLPSNQGTPNYNWIITTSPYNVGLTPATGISNNIPAFTTSANNTGIAQSGVVTLGASLNNCPSTFSTFNITVYPTPTPKFSYAGPVCQGYGMNFTDLSKPNTGSITVTQWGWDMNNDGLYTESTIQNPQQYTVTPAGVDSIGLIVFTNSNPSCWAMVKEAVFVSPNPVALFVGDSLKSCPQLNTTFTDLSSVTINGVPTTSITTWAWTFGNSHTSNASAPAQQSYTNASPTQSAYFNVSLTVTTDSGCVNKKTINNYIQVYPRPIADFGWGPAGVDIDDPTVTFVDQSLGASAYTPQTYGPNGIQYYLGDVFAVNQNSNTVYGGPTNTTFSHVYEYYDPYTYYVTQWVINSMGCKDSITKPVEILPNFTFYIPNAFSPNGDGTNEGFKGTGIGIDNTTYNFWIFDRWGMMIFYADDLEKAWDGHMRGSDGRPILQQDVYVWKVKFQDKINHKEHEYHGTVTLLK